MALRLVLHFGLARPRWLAAGALGVSMAACAHGESELEREVTRLRRELHQTRSELRAAESRLSALETRMSRVSSPEPARRPAQNPEVEEPPEAPPRRLRVVRIGPTGEEVLESEAEGSGGAVDRGQPPVMIRIQGERTESLEVEEDSGAPDPASDPDAAYTAALSLLREENDPGGALEAFDAFRAAHPRHDRVDNALYWSGVALANLLEHERAIARFRTLVRKHPRSNKVPWAKLREAESLLDLGRTEKGARRLRAVLRDHPNTEVARLARARLETLTSVNDENES